MKNPSQKTRPLFVISGFFLIISLSAFLLYAFAGTGSPRYPASAEAESAIETGKGQLFSKTVDGGLNAYQTFQSAYGSYYGGATDLQKIKIRTYLAVTRLFDVLFRNDGGAVDTLSELLAQYGMTLTGNAFEEVDVTPPPMNHDGKVILPATAPSGEALRGYLSGPFVAALDASIADMDAVISLHDLVGEAGSKQLIEKSYISPDDPTQPHIEVDSGDYYLLRAGLKMMKAHILLLTAYNLDVNVREIATLGNMEALMNPRMFLDRYPDLLKLMTAGGNPGYDSIGRLAEAKATLMSAIDDYVVASQKVRSDSDTTAGAEELTSIEGSGLAEEAILRDQLVEIKRSLSASDSALLGTIDATWEFVSVPSGDRLRFSMPDGYFGNGRFDTASDTSDFISRGGSVDYAVINGSTIAIYVHYSGYYYGKALFVGTFSDDTRTRIINGQYYGWNYGTGQWVPQGAFYADRTAVEDERMPVNFNALFGNGATAVSLRDMLPQFNAFGLPIRGTMGHGLGNDPTLGGLLPDFTTQDQWTRAVDILQPSGDVAIAARTINVLDIGITDWAGIDPVFTDVTDETDDAGQDFEKLYLAKDGSNLYIRMDMAGVIPQDGYEYLRYSLQLTKMPEIYRDDGVMIDVLYFPWNQPGYQWGAGISKNNGYSWSHVYTYQVFGNTIEIAIPLSEVGELGGRFISVETNRDSWNGTCLQITPAAGLTGTLSIPGYDGQGLIHIGVYQYNPGLTRDALIGQYVLYPGQYTEGMTYAVNDLPLNEQVFVTVHWDRDMNGLVTPGDYTNMYSPLTLAQNTVLNIDASDRHSSYPAPALKNPTVFCVRSPSGPQSFVMGTFVKGPGAGDVTVAVTGPTGRFELAPAIYFNNRLGLYYSMSFSYLPDGDYTFEAVDSLGRRVGKAVHYAYNGTLPFVSNLLPASLSYVGNTTPTLSWTMPAGNYYSQVYIWDMEGKVNLYLSAVMPPQTTSMTVPAGLLQPNTPYQWSVRLYASAANRTNATQIGAAFYTGAYAPSPAIGNALLYSLPPSPLAPVYKHYGYVYLPGKAPWHIASFTLTSPSSQILYSGVPWSPWNANSSYYADTRLYMVNIYRIVFYSNAPLADGNYTVAVQTNSGLVSAIIPYTNTTAPAAVNLASLDPGNKAYLETLTPTLSWKPISEPGARYRVTVLDGTSSPVNPGKRAMVWQSDVISDTSIQIPAGVLIPGATYYWQVGSMLGETSNVNNWTSNMSSTRWRFTIQGPFSGDINLDYQVDLADAITAMQAVAGLTPSGVSKYYMSPFHPVIKSDIDVNADNRIGPEEVIYILQKAADLR